MIAGAFLPILAELTGSAQWIVPGAIVVGVGIVLFKPKLRPRKDPLQRSPEAGSLAQHRSVERQMQNLLVELSEMSRQVTAGLDTRAARLDALIREADEKIAAMTLLRETMNHPDAPRMNAVMAQPSEATVEDMIAPVMAPQSAILSPSPYDSDPRHSEVYLLADQGQTASEIAAQLQRPSGEIQLILALRAKPS